VPLRPFEKKSRGPKKRIRTGAALDLPRNTRQAVRFGQKLDLHLRARHNRRPWFALATATVPLIEPSLAATPFVAFASRRPVAPWTTPIIAAARRSVAARTAVTAWPLALLATPRRGRWSASP
jgi:hypothetical protein